jgi:hypothetical protein
MALPIEEFRATLDREGERLSNISEERAATRSAPGRWSAKEVIGHLIDSASNNHQRFIRVQLENNLSMPGYEQNAWVETARYQEIPWNDLVRFWLLYNRHLLHVMVATPPEKLSHRVEIKGDDPVTLEFVMSDYLRHLKHHLAQIES